MKNYKEKLTDPRWQKKRLKVLQRDDWSCRYCQSKEKSLHVHHLKYQNNPWDIDDKYLITLCGECHEKYGEYMTNREMWKEAIINAQKHMEEFDKIFRYFSIRKNVPNNKIIIKELLEYKMLVVKNFQLLFSIGPKNEMV